MNEGWLRRMRRSMRAAWRALGTGSDSARVVEREGLLAAVLPAVPERSVFNSVLYERPQDLAAALPQLGPIYERAGVRAWTVWVPEDDEDSARLLESAGHHLDAAPRAMVLDLAELDPTGPTDLDWTSQGSLQDVKRINDAAYGYADRTFARGIGDPPDGAWRIHTARLEGRPASVLTTTDVDGDCGVWWVATVPEARGRGLARKLLRATLDEAKQRGGETSTLQATKMGYPVYERLGYRDIGAFQMWERRR